MESCMPCWIGRQVHIADVYLAKKLMPFPGESKKVHRCRKKHLFIPVYCICGLPESYDSDMISCDRCGQWFHFRCMHIQTPPPETWFCSDCIQLVSFFVNLLFILFCCSISNISIGVIHFRGVIHFQEPMTSGESFLPGESHCMAPIGVSDWGIIDRGNHSLL